MIGERTLKKWRKEALQQFDQGLYEHGEGQGLAKRYVELEERILKMTQELLDQHLLRREK